MDLDEKAGEALGDTSQHKPYKAMMQTGTGHYVTLKQANGLDPCVWILARSSKDPMLRKLLHWTESFLVNVKCQVVSLIHVERMVGVRAWSVSEP